MNRMLGILVVMVFGAFFKAPFAMAETLEHVKIIEIRSRVLGNNSIIRFSEPFSEKCSDNGLWGYMSTDGSDAKNLAWSLVISAAANGKTVTVYTNGECAYHNKISEISVAY